MFRKSKEKKLRNENLKKAAEEGNLALVRESLAKGADVNVKEKYTGYTALQKAAYKGHLEVVQCLIASGADVNAKDTGTGYTALYLAATGGTVGNLKTGGYLEVVQCLIASGADVNAKTGTGYTALHEAASKGHLDVVQCLIANGAAVNEKDGHRNTALHEAASKGHLEVVQWLIANGAAMNEQNDFGDTALHDAAKKGHLKVVQCLMANGATVNKEDVCDYISLREAAENGILEVVQYLIANGAPMNKKGARGNTALHDAASYGHIEVVRWLIANGAAVNEKNIHDMTALHSAACFGHIEVVQWLIANGAAVNEKDNKGNTALHYLAKNGYLKAVQCLIANGATVNEKNKKGETAFDLATKPEVKEYLKNVSLDPTEDTTSPSAESSSKSLAKPLPSSSPLLPRPTALSKPAPTPVRLPTVLPVNKPSPVKAAPTLKVPQSITSEEVLKQFLLAAGSGNLQEVHQLWLANNTLVSEKKDGYTALHMAAVRGHLEVVKYLVEKGASVNEKDRRGRTAFDVATELQIREYLKAQQASVENILSPLPSSYQDTEESPLPPVSTFLPKPAPNPSGLPTILPPIPVASTSSTSRIATALPAKPRPKISSQPTPPQPRLPTVFPVSKSSPTILTPTPEAPIASPSSARRDSLLVNNEGSMQMNIGIPYEKLEFKKGLGSGSYGAVHRGKCGDSKVAIKCLHDQTPQVLEAFKQEISLMMSLNSEYIIRTIGGCFELGHYAIVMEYGKKGALSQLLREPETCPEEDAIKIADWGVRYQMALDIARGMAYLHSRMPTVIHADLKSDNVIIDQYYRAKLSDFGCSKLKTSTSSKATLLGPKWAGTSSWMAPEVLDGESTTPASDSYSFGVTLWELGARKIPLAGKKESQIINLVVNQDQREPVSVDTPSKMAQLIRWCWSKQPEARPTLSQAVEILTEEYKEQFKKKK